MKSLYYYTVTFIFYVIIIIGAIFIPNVDVIFEFIGIISVNAISFLIPGVFYITASRRHEAKGHKRNTCLVVTAYFQLLGGIIYFFLGAYNQIAG